MRGFAGPLQRIHYVSLRHTNHMPPLIVCLYIFRAKIMKLDPSYDEVDNEDNDGNNVQVDVNAIDGPASNGSASA